MNDPGTTRAELASRFAAASTLAGNGDLASAREAFAQITRDFPDCHEAHYMLGRTSLAGGDTAFATSSFERAEALDPGNPEYMLRLGQVALSCRDDTAAIHWFERAREESAQDSAELATGYARALTMARRFPQADEAYQRACELDPDDSTLWIAWSGVQTRRGNPDGAEASLRRATQCSPSDPGPYADLAVMLEHANRLDSAREAMEASLRLEPKHSKALIARARLSRRNRDLIGARHDLEQAIAHATSPDVRQLSAFTLAQVLDESGEYDAAFECLAVNTKSISDLGTSQRRVSDSLLQLIAAQRREITPSLIQSWPEAPPDNRISPVFFVGFPRSGTTLLEQMLAAHPHFVTTDEQPSLFTVQANLVKAAGSEALLPAALGQLSDEQICHLRSLYWHEVDGFLGPLKTGIRVVDKHPMNGPNLAIAHRLFPDAPVIMSLRDPRDLCVSCVMNLARSPMAATFFRTFQTTAEVYAAFIDLWFLFKEALGIRYIETRYEDVVGESENEIRRVLEFLGVPWDDAVLHYQARARERAIRTASYEQVTRKLHKGSIGRWRNYEKYMGSALQTLAPFVDTLGYGDNES